MKTLLIFKSSPRSHTLAAISQTRYFAVMPPLQNTRHELFAQAIARGDPAYRAYGDLYGAESHAAEANGSRLMKNDRVATRIGELKARTAVRTEKTAASLVKDLDDAIEFAKACKNPSAVVRAIVAQARLLGLVVDRSEVSVQHRPAPWPTKTIELSEAEWVAKFSTGPGPRPALTDQGKRLEAEKRKLNGNTRPEPIGEDRSESWRPAAGSLTAIPSDVRECQAEIHKREGGLFLICHVVCLKPLPRRSFSGRQKPANKIYSRQKTRPTNQSHFELSYTTSRDNDTAGCIFQSIRMGYKAWVGAVVLPQRD